VRAGAQRIACEQENAVRVRARVRVRVRVRV